MKPKVVDAPSICYNMLTTCNAILEMTFHNVLSFSRMLSLFFIRYHFKHLPLSILFATHGGTSEEKKREMKLQVQSCSYLPALGNLSIT